MNSKVRIAESLARLKKNWVSILEEDNLRIFCLEEGLRWRERILTSVRTIQLFLLQILHGNTACSHLPHLSKMEFSAMAYCKARMRLPLRIMEGLVMMVSKQLPSDEYDSQRWRGHRIWLADGTG
jgi:hypothetical protein